MKKIIIAAVAFGVLFISTATLNGCKDKKEGSQDSITGKVINIDKGAEYEDKSLTDTFASGGHTFGIAIHRYSDTAGKEYKDEYGDAFFDNIVDIRTTRDGEELFSKNFTKSSFRSHIDADTASYILQGIGFDKAKSDANNLTFGVQLGDPGSEEGKYFLLLTIAPTGEIDIRKDNAPDTTADDGGIELKQQKATEPADEPDEQI